MLSTSQFQHISIPMGTFLMLNATCPAQRGHSARAQGRVDSLSVAQ